MTDVERLQQTIKDLHGCDSEHIESVPIHEVFRDQTVWEGTVEVFRWLDHPTAKQAYAWSYKTDEGKRQYVAILGVPPVNTAINAVRADVVSQSVKKSP